VTPSRSQSVCRAGSKPVRLSRSGRESVPNDTYLLYRLGAAGRFSALFEELPALRPDLDA
jgi:hypothetical protein